MPIAKQPRHRRRSLCSALPPHQALIVSILPSITTYCSCMRAAGAFGLACLSALPAPSLSHIHPVVCTPVFCAEHHRLRCSQAWEEGLKKVGATVEQALASPNDMMALVAYHTSPTLYPTLQSLKAAKKIVTKLPPLTLGLEAATAAEKS